MNMSNYIGPLRNLLTDKRAECAVVRARYGELLLDCAELQRILDDLLTDQEQPIEVLDASVIGDTLTDDEPDADPPSGYPMDIDISDASNHIERVRLLTLRTEDHEIDVDRAARWLVEMGASDGKVSSLISRLYRDLKQLNYFRKIGPRVYRYIPLEEDEYDTEVIPFGIKDDAGWTTRRL